MGKGDIAKVSGGFTAHPERRWTKGRYPKDPVSRVIKEMMLKHNIEELPNAQTVMKMIYVLFCLTEIEINELAISDETPIWIKIVINRMQSTDAKSKFFQEVLLDRILGKAKETFEIQGEIKETKEEIKTFQVIINGEVKKPIIGNG